MRLIVGYTLRNPWGVQKHPNPLVNDPGMHHGTCVTHVPWCMSGSLTSGGGENVPGLPGAYATRNFTYLTRGPCAIATLSKRSPIKEVLITFNILPPPLPLLFGTIAEAEIIDLSTAEPTAIDFCMIFLL